MAGRLVRWFGAALAAMVLVFANLVPARAEGGADCDVHSGICGVSDIDPGLSGPGGSGDGPSGGDDKAPELPECSSFGTGYDELPDDVANPGGWVQMACMEGDIAITLWVEGSPNPEQIARTLLARVQLRPIDIGLTPLDPEAMTVVGMPVWLWVDEPSRTTWGPATITAGGVTLTAQVRYVVWEMGDGTTLRCGKGTEWRRGMVNPDRTAYESPTCGHVYVEQGQYTVRARSHWVATWSGYGRSGSIPVMLSTTRRLDVGEIQVIATGG